MEVECMVVEAMQLELLLGHRLPVLLAAAFNCCAVAFSDLHILSFISFMKRAKVVSINESTF